MDKILLVSPKKSLSKSIGKMLNKSATELCVTTLAGLAEKLSEESPHCIVIAVENPDEVSKDSFLKSIRQFDDNLPVIVLSRSKEVDAIVELMKRGVYDYLSLPTNPQKLALSVHNACRLYDLTKKVFLLEKQLGQVTHLDDMVGKSPAMQTLFQTIQNVAKTDATVLILGESGTGKELVAKAIHRLSPRDSRRFIDINCGAIPRELLENELFGHERGAYTGADKRYIGCCERANGGSLFLDEISEMDPSLQVKLLRFLQERQFTRVGGLEPIKVDVRIIAATNRNLQELASKNEFREDLFYRLNVVAIALPPLRERREDIPLLAQHFLEKYTQKNEKIFLDFSPEAMEALLQYEWPGNIRELENTIERAVVLHNDTKIKWQHLPDGMRKKERTAIPLLFSTPMHKMDAEKILPLTLVERYAIEAALKACTGNVAHAAKVLKIGQATLYRKIKQYGIRV